MRRRTGFIGAAVIGGAVLSGAIAAGYLEERFRPQPATASFGQGASEAQTLERRRGRAATAAVAEAAVN